MHAFPSRHAWAAWLADHHATSSGVWLQIAKTGSAAGSVAYPEALEVAICYGWIDGQKRSLNADHWLQRFTPRRARSRWSRINRDRADELIRSGAMQPAGLREVDLARADGRWDAAYESPSRATVPVDLQLALDSNQAAAAFFATLNSQNRYAILYRIAEAKKPETRAQRVAKFVAMLAEGKQLHN